MIVLHSHPAWHIPGLTSRAWKVNFVRILAEKARILKREALGPSLPPRENLQGKRIISFPPLLSKCWQPTGWSREMGTHRVKSSPDSTKTACKPHVGSSQAIFPPPSAVLPAQKGEGHAGELQ